MENTNFTPEDEAMLRDSLKRCSPETIEAAVEFRKTGDVSKVNTVILGIIARYAEPEKRPLLDNPSDDMVLAQDLNQMKTSKLCAPLATSRIILPKKLLHRGLYGFLKSVFFTKPLFVYF